MVRTVDDDPTTVQFKKSLLEAQSEAALDGILVVSHEGRILSFNTQFAKLWQIPETVLATGRDEEALHFVLNQLADPVAFLNRVKYLYANPDEDSFEEIPLKDGRIVERHSRPIKSGSQYYGRVWFFRDTTQRKRVEEELREARNTYLALVNSIEGIVWEVEVDHEMMRFTFVSKQAERLLGYPVEAWLSTPSFWVDHMHPDDAAWAPGYCLKATREQKDHQFEYRMTAADGRTVWLRDLVTVIVEDGKAVKLRGIMVDITQRKVAEKEVQDLNQKLSDRILDLEKFEDVVVGRELKMMALEKELEELRAENKRLQGQLRT